jgi:hypothetical protein
MSPRSLERLAWVLIYGGLLMLSLGAFVLDADAVAGWVLLALGGAALAGGVVAVWLRSRR